MFFLSFSFVYCLYFIYIYIATIKNLPEHHKRKFTRTIQPPNCLQKFNYYRIRYDNTANCQVKTPLLHAAKDRCNTDTLNEIIKFQ